MPIGNSWATTDMPAFAAQQPSYEGAGWPDWLEGLLEELKAAGRWRQLEDFDLDPSIGTTDRAGLVSFASNDYLGLGTDQEVRQEAARAASEWGSGSGASRLVGGSRSLHRKLEAELAAWKSCERAIVFPTGYMANLGVLTGLASEGTAIFSDSLNHASIIDGARLAHASVSVFPHLDYAYLAELMAQSHSRRKIIVSDACFSMDGDFADLGQLLEIAKRNDALVVLDEAHSVLGPEIPVDFLGEPWLVRVGTLSKTLGSSGGFVACSGPIADALVNTSRPFIFTTAPPPSPIAAATKALEIIRSHRGKELVEKLRANIRRISPEHRSPVIPVILGEDAAAVNASRLLRDHGYYVPAIRPPTVPKGTARLRFSISALHTADQISGLLSLSKELGIQISSPNHSGD